MNNIGREDLRDKPIDRLCADYGLCSDHFEGSQFTTPNKRNKLKWNSVPTLFNIPTRPVLISTKQPCMNTHKDNQITYVIIPKSGKEVIKEDAQKGDTDPHTTSSTASATPVLYTILRSKSEMWNSLPNVSLSALASSENSTLSSNSGNGTTASNPGYVTAFSTPRNVTTASNSGYGTSSLNPGNLATSLNPGNMTLPSTPVSDTMSSNPGYVTASSNSRKMIKSSNHVTNPSNHSNVTQSLNTEYMTPSSNPEHATTSPKHKENVPNDPGNSNVVPSTTSALPKYNTHDEHNYAGLKPIQKHASKAHPKAKTVSKPEGDYYCTAANCANGLHNSKDISFFSFPNPKTPAEADRYISFLLDIAPLGKKLHHIQRAKKRLYSRA